MSGYAASARIVRATPHAIRHDRRFGVAEARSREAGPVVIEGGTTVGGLPAVTFDERLERFHDRWAQLTFFLTDPDSWR